MHGAISRCFPSIPCNSAYHRVMRSTPLLVEATPTSGYTVHARFEDGVAADVDLSYLPAYGGVFEPLHDLDYFRRLQANAEAGTITWPNEADIAPETLYERASNATDGGAVPS